MAAPEKTTTVADLTATAVLELARLGRVTDETYDALKAATTPPETDDDDQADEQTADKSAATKATTASKGASR